MPPVVKTTIGDIEMWVRQGLQAAWDIGTSQAVITGDEYSLKPFLHSPMRLKVQTVVDIGANIGAFTLAARRTFPHARVIAIEPDPDNVSLLQRNCGDDALVTICQTAVATMWVNCFTRSSHRLPTRSQSQSPADRFTSYSPILM